MEEIFKLAHHIEECINHGYNVSDEDVDTLIMVILRLESQLEQEA
jgi:hypothetical protein